MFNEERKKKLPSAEDRLYRQKDDLNSCLAQAFHDLKQARNNYKWGDRLVEELNGVTLRRMGTDAFELSYHRIYTGSPTDAQNYERESKKFLDEVMKELKKHFRNLSGKTLEVKKTDEKKTIDKYSRLTAEYQSLYGSTTYGGIIGRFYLICSRIYHIESPKPQTGSPEKGPAVWG